MTRQTETFWLKWLLLLVVSALSWALAHAAPPPPANVYETPPPKTNSIAWEHAQLLNKQRQEIYRKRLVIPSTAVSPDVPRVADALNSTGNPLNAAAAVHAFQAAPGGFQKSLFCTVLLVVAGFFVVRKLTPEILTYLSQRYNPWAAAPEVERTFPANVREEDASFDKFLTAFRVGPTTAAPAEATPAVNRADEFYGLATAILVHQRELLEEIVRVPGGLARQKLLSDLRGEMYLLKDVADFPDALPVWQLATAVEGLLKQLTDKMGNVTPSSLRTVVGGVQLLEDLCSMGLQPQLLTDRPLKFLVADDEMISRHALSFALGKAFTKPDVVEDAVTAMARINEQAYDAIFLDVQMPDMDGFELCVKIHDTPLNRNTPVVFVTGQGDFNARARSTLSGGNDLMAKPFLTFEVTVKALTLALQGRLHGRAPNLEREMELMDPLLQTFVQTTRPVVGFDLAPRGAAPSGKDEFTAAFLSRASQHIDALRDLSRQLPLAEDEGARQALIVDGFLRINSMISLTDSEMIHPAYQMSTALEGLFRKLLESARLASPTTLATLNTAVDLLHELCAPGVEADLASDPPVELLVVDDDLITRRTIAGALQTAFNRPVSVESGEAALALAADKSFDVIFMDVVMPGMDGFETCAKIRATIPNSHTPVVFVTGQQNAAAQEQMKRSGGSELLVKPFLTSEINVKALTFALRRRLQRAGRRRRSPPPQTQCENAPIFAGAADNVKNFTNFSCRYDSQLINKALNFEVEMTSFGSRFF